MWYFFFFFRFTLLLLLLLVLAVPVHWEVSRRVNCVIWWKWLAVVVSFYFYDYYERMTDWLCRLSSIGLLFHRHFFSLVSSSSSRLFFGYFCAQNDCRCCCCRCLHCLLSFLNAWIVFGSTIQTTILICWHHVFSYNRERWAKRKGTSSHQHTKYARP